MADMNKLTEGLTKIVGSANFTTDKDFLKAYTEKYKGFSEPEIPIGMVWVCSTEEVQSVIRFVKDEIGCGIVPASSEDSIKLTGSSLPAKGTEAIILNLRRMNRIFRIDERNRVAFVEAGVTFAELEDALRGTGLKLDYPFLARPDKSVIAALLDRDPITAPMNVWDTNDPLLCLEIVFGEGTVFRTGSAVGPGTLEELWENGVAMTNSMGPAHLDFARVLSGSQGTLGVVTWASVKLEYDLSVQKMQYVTSDDVSGLAPIAQKGIRRRLGNNYVILNDFALGNAIGMEREEISGIAEKAPAWTLAIDVAGKRLRPEQKVEYQTKDLRAMVRSAPIRKEVKDSIDAVPNLKMQKILTGLNEGKFWKHRFAGNAIDIYFLTTLNQVDKFYDVAASVAGERKIAAYIQPTMQGRNAHVEFVIPYSEEEQEEAKQLSVELMEALLEAGAFFSRPFGVCQDKIFEKAPMQVKTIGKLKKMFDDQYVLNPNRFFVEVNE